MFSRFNPPPKYKATIGDESMTIQSAADECDINKMIARHRATGSYHGIANVPTGKPQFGEFVDVPTFMEAQSILLQATEHFASLPSVIRDRFGNNPIALLDFLSNEANRDEALKLGIVSAPPLPPPEPVIEVVEEQGKTLLKKRSG